MLFKQSKIPVLITFAVLSCLTFAHGVIANPQADLAPAPPMGWNSFDSYGVYLHEEAALANVEAMAEKLKPHGYEYYIVDNGWFGEYKLQAGTIFPAEKHAHDININAFGYFLPSKVYFPNGLKPIANRCHELGLKFGVHLMRGIPRKAYELNLPIQGTAYTARDVAITDPKLNCKWCQYCYGVDMTHPGGQAWYDGLIQHVADLGVDFIKYDDIVPYPAEVEAVAKAIRKCGRPIVLSLSPGGKVDPNAIDSFRHANMLRVTKDVWDEQHYIDECFKAWRKWQGRERHGFWIDMDMIPFGQLQLMSPRNGNEDPISKGDIALAGKGVNRWSQLSDAQKRTFITLRALAASPLMMGGDLPSLDTYSLALITNRQILACNQNGVMGKCLFERDGVEVWQVLKKGRTDTGWVGIFNRSQTVQGLNVTPQILGLDYVPPVDVLDVWNNQSFLVHHDQSQLYQIEPNDVLFLSFQPAPIAKRPNIVYILSDDLGYGDLSLNGQEHFSTPNIDRLAKEGMNFTNHYSGSTVCAPSRCSLMTGLHTGHTQVRGNREIQPEGQAAMDPGTVTIPTLLKQAGYVSGMFGKWGLGYPGSASNPMVFFDEFYGYNCQRYAHRYYPAYLWHNDKKVELEGNHWINKTTFAPDQIHHKALEFIAKNNSKKTGNPFFMYYSTNIPHAELIAPQDEILQKFQGKFDERPYPGGNTDDLARAPYGPNMDIPAYCPQKNPKAEFAALVTRLDKYVGEIIAKLKELGIDDDTIVIFTSDNGAHAEGGIHPDDFDSNGQWRGMKRDLYEGGIRVPMIARWPGQIKPGTTSDHISAFWDMLPTFCELAGVKTPKDIDGISMLPALLQNSKEQKQHDYLYWELTAQGGRQAIRKGAWKAVKYNVKGNPDAEIELYNLTEDPGEKKNIASGFPEIIREMKGLFEKARAGSETFPLFK